MTQPQSEHRQARDAWCATRTLGDNTAVFYPGDELRCPGTRTRYDGDRGTVCGIGLLDKNGRVGPGTQVIVRVRTGWFPKAKTPNLPLVCRSCGTPLEILALLEATG